MRGGLDKGYFICYLLHANLLYALHRTCKYLIYLLFITCKFIICVTQDVQIKHIRIHKVIADQIKMQICIPYGVTNRSANIYFIGKKQLGLPKCQTSIKSTLHYGRKAETDEVENEIVDWMQNRSLGISVSSWELFIKACSLNNIYNALH